METVEVVIKIPQEIFNTIWAYVQSGINNKNIISDTAYKAIANGTVLPKGHGALKDVEVIDDSFFDFAYKAQESDYCFMDYTAISRILEDTPTIIEADKEADNG